MTDTYIITSVATADDETAMPARATAGNTIDWSTTADWDQVAFEFDEDEFANTMADNGLIKIKPPAKPVATGYIFNSVAIESLEFTTYEIGKNVYDIATNGTYVAETGIYSFSTTHTNKALVIEFGGVGILYFPSVMITFEPPKAGIWSLAKQNGLIYVCGTDTVPAGYQWAQNLPSGT